MNLPQKYCRQICKKSGSNFVYAFYLLGRDRRLAMEVFYAFCRLVDDCVDEAPTSEQAREKLKFWRGEIPKIYQGDGQHTVSKALGPVVKKYQIPQRYLEEIVAGCEMDLVKKSYATFQELEQYCFRVASCVGLVSLRIFGVAPSAETDAAGASLGVALQLTNILRDIATDLKRGRIYLPQEDLQRFRVPIENLNNPSRDNLNLIDILYCEIERARAYFSQAWNLFPKWGRQRRRLIAAMLMGKFYEALLDKISRDPMSVFRNKIRLTGTQKLKIALKVLADTYLQ